MKSSIYFTSKLTKSTIQKCWNRTSRRNYNGGPLPDWSFLENPIKTKALMDNMQLREGTTNLEKIQHLVQQIKNGQNENENSLHKELQREIDQIPNLTHPDISDLKDANEIAKYGVKPEFSFEPKPFATIAKRLNQCRTEHLGNFSGVKSYYLMKDLADLVRFLFSKF